MNKDIKIGIIIPCYDFYNMTYQCITSVLKHTGIDIDIIVIDNGSKEPYIDNRVQVFRLDKNIGFTNAVNYGLAKCLELGYTYIGIVSNDIIAEPDFIKLLIEKLESDKELAIVSSARIMKREPYSLETYPADLFKGYQNRHYKDLNDDIIYCSWVAFCSVILNAEAVRYIGLLDKRMINYCSDNDYCFRAQELGYKVALVPKSKVFHIGEVTTKHANNIPLDDQKILLDKIIGTNWQKRLNTLPLDWSSNLWGKLNFIAYNKGN